MILLGLWPPGTARAQVATPSVDLVKVQGAIDPALAGYVRGTIERAERAGSTVVLQIDSRGSFGDQAESLGRFVRAASVPVVSWIGPLGARAAGGALLVAYSSSLVTMAPGAGIGPATPFDLGTRASREDPAEVRRLGEQLAALAPGAGATASGVRRLIGGPALPAGPAVQAGAIGLTAVDLPDLLSMLDGRSVTTARGPMTLVTANRPGHAVDVRFHEIGPVRRVLHAVSTPTAVYILLVLGLWAIAFELTQPGFGVAGIAGIVALALGGYGLTVVPVHWLGLALIVAGVGLQGLDVVIRRVAALTILGAAAFAAGSFLAWFGVAPAIDLAPWLVLVMTIAGFLYFGFALTVALRSRERIREAQVGLVGLLGEVRTDLDPEGGVYVKGTMWRARSMDGHIPRGARVRVRGVDGLILRVEQEFD
jgi:membrane-bound serine protease (ClpP class)